MTRKVLHLPWPKTPIKLLLCSFAVKFYPQHPSKRVPLSIPKGFTVCNVRYAAGEHLRCSLRLLHNSQIRLCAIPGGK